MRGTIHTSQKHLFFYWQVPWIWAFKQKKEDYWKCFLFVGWVLQEKWENNFPMVSSLTVFWANLAPKNQKAWSEPDISPTEGEYLILRQWKLDLISLVISFWKSVAWQAHEALAVWHGIARQRGVQPEYVVSWQGGRGGDCPSVHGSPGHWWCCLCGRSI